MLPDSVLPDPNRRLLTSLFLATALSISSVKIVAAVLREVEYLHRNLGQVILAAAILDDTIAWTILAFIGGLATQGRIVIGPALFSVLGTAAFLAFCFTIGRRWVGRIIGRSPKPDGDFQIREVTWQFFGRSGIVLILRGSKPCTGNLFNWLNVSLKLLCARRGREKPMASTTSPGSAPIDACSHSWSSDLIGVG
jgi:hypothetical protein